MAGQKVTLTGCPNCGGELAIVDILEHRTPAGTVFGETLIKCINGCKPRDIFGPAREISPLSDMMFIEMIEHARSIGKRITLEDKDRELDIKMRILRAVEVSY